MHILRLCGLGRTLHRDHFQSADFGEDVDESRQCISFESGLTAIGVPVVVLVCSVDFLLNLLALRSAWIVRLMLAVQYCHCECDAWDEGARGKTVFTDVDTSLVSLGEVLGQPVGLVVSKGKLTHRYLESDMPQIAEGRHTMMRNFIDVEGKLRLHMLVLALGVADHGSVFRAKLGELHRNRAIGSNRMA